MNLNDQVCSIDLSKRLKELGVKQESYFYWAANGNNGDQWEVHHFNQSYSSDYSAFSAAELGELLPNKILIEANAPFDCFAIYITKFNSVDEKSIITNNYIVNYECDSTPAGGVDAWLRRKLTSNFYDKNLADAMAKMLIHLLENGLIKNDS